MNIKDVLSKASNMLIENKIENPIMHARILLANKLKKTKEYLIIHENEEIKESIVKEYKEDILQLISGKPLQYITNHQEFMKLDFYVDENVLVPRPDTEILVEEVINIAKQINKSKINILDLCTGSGAIAVSIGAYIKNAKITAADISSKALNVAKENAKKNNVQIELIKSDMFENIKQKFDIIVSNPPYIQTKIIKTLSKNVQKEPEMALDGGEDGLKFYKQIAKNADKFLEHDGYLCLEIGYDQNLNVTKLLKETNKYRKIYSKKDLSGNDRIIIAKR